MTKKTILGIDIGYDQLKLALVSGGRVVSTASAAMPENLMVDGRITSSQIDSLQGKVAFDATGTITTDLTADMLTKNELGEAYGMKAIAKSKYEWNEQAAAFADYVEGKTAAEVAGIAVNEKAAPTDADIASTVTISVGGFQALIAKAAQ